MRPRNNVRGKTFGRLTVLRDSGEKCKNGEILWRCLCLCGNFAKARSAYLISGRTKSCGCIKAQREQTHTIIRNMRKHGYGIEDRLYRIWRTMKQRCHNPNARDYRWYGSRGIEVCEEWRKDYMVFREWALNNGYQDSLEIDKVNNDGNYEPSNCQWITHFENMRKYAKDRR